MPEATEIVFLHLKEGINLEEEDSWAAQQWKNCATTISQQKGFLRLYWGLKVEDPETLVSTIDWKDVQDHKDFVNSEAYQPFIGELTEIFDFAAAPPLFYHVNFAGDSVTPREAAVTEFAPFNVDLASSDDKRSSLEDAALKVGKGCTDNGSAGFAIGWALEEQDHSDAPDGKTKLLQALIGWNSVEQHMQLREKPEFPPLIQPVRELTIPAQQGKTMFHVKLRGLD